MTAQFHQVVGGASRIANWSNRENKSTLWWRTVELLRHPSRGYLVASFGGGGMRTGDYRFISDDDARQFLTAHAYDGITGYAYTAEEVEILMSGVSTSGSRDADVERPEASEWA